MKIIPCEVQVCYEETRLCIELINKLMADAGHSAIRLALAKEGETPKLSIVDNVPAVTQARGVILFINCELAAHNPLLMDYSALLTGSSSPRSHQTAYFLHHWVFRGLFPSLPRHKKPKTRFCAFIQRHQVARRNRFVQKLQRRKEVDCPGACLNNMEPLGKSWDETVEFMGSRKFTVTFEHSAYPDYITEKIYLALAAGSVPIYSGSPTIARYVNPEAFINVDDFPTEDAAIDHIMRVDRDPQLYERYLHAEPILENSLTHHDTKESLALFLKRALDRVAAGQQPRRSYFIRFYRRVYLAYSMSYYSVSNIAMADGEGYVHGIPIHRMPLSRRMWLREIPRLIKAKAAHMANKLSE